MTDDIVTRLREQVCECGYAASFNELHKCLRCEAVDEIERLRADRDRFEAIAEQAIKTLESALAIIEQIQGAVHREQ